MERYPPTDWTRHPLHVATMSVNLETVQSLLRQGVNVNEDLPFYGTPLHLAAKFDSPLTASHRELIRLLLQSGADLNAQRDFSGTPLHDAALWGHEEFATLLLAHGADVNSRLDDHGRTPLHLAVCASLNPAHRVSIVKFLIANGADVNAMAVFNPSPLTARLYRELGMTPLHVAARDGHVEVARVLIRAGASIDTRISEQGAAHLGRPPGTARDLAIERLNRLADDRSELEALAKDLKPGF